MPILLSDDRLTVFAGDALTMLAELDTGSVDAVFADPPYSSGGQFRSDRTASTRTKYVQTDAQADTPDFSGDNRDSRAYGYWSALWLSEALRVTRPGGVCAVFTDWRQLPTTSDAIQAGGWVWRGVVPWHKPTARPVQGRWSNSCEYLVWGTAGARPLEGSPLPGFYQVSAPRDRVHMTQKPIEVLTDLMRIVPPGGTVLDPFMGSGTTGVAALSTGRSFIGAELNPDYLDIAVRRLQTARNLIPETEDGQQALTWTN